MLLGSYIEPAFPRKSSKLTMVWVQVEGLNLKNIPGCSIHRDAPTLWVHGGHPFVPSSADIYYKMHQLFSLCDEIWPRSKNQTTSGMVNSLFHVIPFVSSDNYVVYLVVFF